MQIYTKWYPVRCVNFYQIGNDALCAIYWCWWLVMYFIKRTCDSVKYCQHSMDKLIRGFKLVLHNAFTLLWWILASTTSSKWILSRLWLLSDNTKLFELMLMTYQWCSSDSFAINAPEISHWVKNKQLTLQPHLPGINELMIHTDCWLEFNIVRWSLFLCVGCYVTHIKVQTMCKQRKQSDYLCFQWKWQVIGFLKTKQGKTCEFPEIN